MGRRRGVTAGEVPATARALVAGGKGLPAMDESNPACNERFAREGIAQTEEARHAYRAHQGRHRMPDMIPGLKVGIGAKDMAGDPGEKITEGMEGLRGRLRCRGLHRQEEIPMRTENRQAVASLRHPASAAPEACSTLARCGRLARPRKDVLERLQEDGPAVTGWTGRG